MTPSEERCCILDAKEDVGGRNPTLRRYGVDWSKYFVREGLTLTLSVKKGFAKGNTSSKSTI